MSRALWTAMALAGAVLVETALSHLVALPGRYLDPFLLVFVYCALHFGETHGMLAGAIATLMSGHTPAAQGTQPGVLQVTVSVASDDGPPTGRRHVLLISDNPPSRSPWRLVTALDGTGKLTLPPGNYTIESEAPLVAGGRALEWRQVVDIPASGTTTRKNVVASEARSVAAASIRRRSTPEKPARADDT